VYGPAGTDRNEHITQLWLWQPLTTSGLSSSGHGWKAVSVGYRCPGQGVLAGRHLVMTEQGKPTWILGVTVHRRYKEVNPYTTVCELEQ
jgi:hypothetical protein